MSITSQDLLVRLATEYDLELVYAFGSRSKELLAWATNAVPEPLTGKSDADIGVKSTRPLTIHDKVTLAVTLEEALGVGRVDLVCVEEADALLAANIIRGELLFYRDRHQADEYELYVLRRAADLAPFERARLAMILNRRTGAPDEAHEQPRGTIDR